MSAEWRRTPKSGWTKTMLFVRLTVSNLYVRSMLYKALWAARADQSLTAWLQHCCVPVMIESAAPKFDVVWRWQGRRVL